MLLGVMMVSKRIFAQMLLNKLNKYFLKHAIRRFWNFKQLLFIFNRKPQFYLLKNKISNILQGFLFYYIFYMDLWDLIEFFLYGN